MKILHTSDWHLGHTLYNYDRTEEQTAMLQQIIEIVKSEKPDLFLLSGDVYHTAQPSSAVQTLFTETIVQIHAAHPDMSIIMTAGNHDSGTKHEIFRTPWQALKVYAIGNLDRENPQSHIIEIPGKAYVIAIPYSYERSIPEGFFQDLLQCVEERNSAQQLPVIMMAHTTVKGCDFKGHDNATELTVGGIDSLEISDLGEGYDYLALGHIHHEQWIRGSHHRIRYSGSPLPVSFDENYEHSVSLITINKHGDEPQLQKIAIENPHPLVTLPASRKYESSENGSTATEKIATEEGKQADNFVSWEEAKQLLENFPADIPAYIRLNVEIEDFLPAEANQEAANLTKEKLCRFCLINARRKQKAQSQQKAMTVQEFQAESPIDIARRYAEDSGIPFDEDLTEMFEEMCQQLQH